jgi:cytochrome c oxidase subunit IV
MSDAPATSHADDQSLAHPVPLGVLFATFGALMILTIFTVMATWVNLGAFNIWLALFIAVIKGSLVAMYFMHLRWDNPFNGIVLIAALFFVALFIGVVVLDGREYKVNYQPPARVGAP